MKGATENQAPQPKSGRGPNKSARSKRVDNPLRGVLTRNTSLPNRGSRDQSVSEGGTPRIPLRARLSGQ